MATVARYARIGYHAIVPIWDQIRRVAVPLMVLFGATALTIGLVGTANGHPELALVPALFVGALSAGVVISRY